MGFWRELFNDDNSINEKSVIGFASFAVMVAAMGVDIVTGYLGKEFILNEYIFNAFLILTLGSFGIASVDKYINKKADTDRMKIDSETPEEEG